MRPDKPAARSQGALVRVADVAFACARSNDLPALIELAGEACRDAVGGYAWRFLSLHAESGTLTLGAPEDGGPAVLPEPGGALDWLLAHESPLVACNGRAGDPSLEAGLWRELPKSLMAWPVRSQGTLRGLMVVALAVKPPEDATALAVPRVTCDQLAVALERHALAVACASQAEKMAQLEERAESGEAMFSELISVVAHEIRTPLTAIKAYTESLIDAPATEFEQRRAFLTVIDEECDRLSRLISDALDLSRLEAGHRGLKLRTIEPRAFMTDLLTTIEPEAGRHGVTLTFEVEAALGMVEGDSDLLKQLMLNLVGNALKFSPADSAVSIRARAAGPEWRLEVEDHGIGIPENQREKIFERFYRVEPKGGRRVSGTGLGLAIARHIVDLHGGRIVAESAAGGGARFTVHLPMRQLAPESARAIARPLAAREDVRRLIATATEMVGDVMSAEIVSVWIVDPDQGDLVPVAARGLGNAVYARRLSYRGGVAGAAIRTGQPLLVDNVETDRRIHKKNHPQYFTKSLLCAPLQVAGETIGVLNVNNKASREDFDEADRALLGSLVARLVSVLNRAHAYPEVPGVVTEACEALQTFARTRRELLAGRRELSHYALEMARRLRLPPEEATRVALLARAEADRVARALVAGSPDGAEAAARSAILLGRSERVDGKGWPRGLAGDAIPLGAKILAVLDEFEALTRGRAYRAAMPVEAALVALAREGNRAFDPRVIEALGATLEDDGRRRDRREAA